MHIQAHPIPPGSDDELQLACACDEAYAMPLATLLRSICEAQRGGLHVLAHVLTDGFSPRLRRRVEASILPATMRLHWCPVRLDGFAGCSTLAGISPMTFARLLLPEVMPAALQRLIYLDTDMLVLKPLDALWHMPLHGAPLAAVVDELDVQLKADAPHLAAVPRVRRYFNAGLLLIDLAAWRREHIAEQARSYLHRHPHTPFADQDALNVACDGRWLELDAQWNHQAHLTTDYAALDASRRPKVVHFVTGRKPWLASSLNRNARCYDEVRGRTRFARRPSQKLADVLLRQWAVLKRTALRHEALQRWRDRQKRSAHA